MHHKALKIEETLRVGVRAVEGLGDAIECGLGSDRMLGDAAGVTGAESGQGEAPLPDSPPRARERRGAWTAVRGAAVGGDGLKRNR